MCFYIIKKYFSKFQDYLISSIMSIYYEIPRNNINKFLNYQEKINYVNNFEVFNNDIDLILIEYLIGEYRIIKIKDYEYPIFKKMFYSDFLNNLFLNNKKVISINYNDDIEKFLTDLVMTIILLYPNPLVLCLYNVTNDSVVTTISNDTIHPNRISHKILKYDNDFLDQRIFNLDLNHFHHFIRIINKLGRQDFNILYEYILENSNHLKPDTIIKDIKIY